MVVYVTGSASVVTTVMAVSYTHLRAGPLPGNHSPGRHHGRAGGLLPEGSHTFSLPLWPAGAHICCRGGGASPLEGQYPCQHRAGNGVLHAAGADGILMLLWPCSGYAMSIFWTYTANIRLYTANISNCALSIFQPNSRGGRHQFEYLYRNKIPFKKPAHTV